MRIIRTSSSFFCTYADETPVLSLLLSGNKTRGRLLIRIITLWTHTYTYTHTYSYFIHVIYTYLCNLILSYHIIFHFLSLFKYISCYFTFFFLFLSTYTCHHIAVLCFSYHVIYHINFICIFLSFFLCFMHAYTLEVDTRNYKGLKIYYHCTRQ